MAYKLMLTVKSTKEINDSARAMAEATGRNRSEYVRDVIKALASDKSLQETVKQAIKDK